MSLIEKLKKMWIGSAKYRQRQVDRLFPICYCERPSAETLEWLLQDLQQQRNELLDYDLLGDPFFSMVFYRFLTPDDKERLPAIDALVAAILERRAFEPEELFRLNGLYGFTLPKAGYPDCPVVTTPAVVTPAVVTIDEPPPAQESEPERLRVFRF
ncbi:hypothetical protein GTO91_09695 [Heliobacterium undosum]|uniref:Uncharacterized protein n=1 Tax=Heliomicrobium undosum TaxID=121734 RepID=A0A845L2R3_9FIRM|nr:hypothetical protein [Heliomicrobium undosum]MZP29976.1 hypothetical protein [Heliomicrobium undosum]